MSSRNANEGVVNAFFDQNARTMEFPKSSLDSIAMHEIGHGQLNDRVYHITERLFDDYKKR